MPVCLQCESRIGVDPDAEQLAGQVIAACLKDNRAGINNDQKHVAKALREFADEAQHGRAIALSVATRLAKASGIRCGISIHPMRTRDVDNQRRLKYDHGFDRRFAVFIDLPRRDEFGGGVDQISWDIHESELQLFTHLEPAEGWQGRPTAAELENRTSMFVRTWVEP